MSLARNGIDPSGRVPALDPAPGGPMTTTRLFLVTLGALGLGAGSRTGDLPPAGDSPAPLPER